MFVYQISCLRNQVCSTGESSRSLQFINGLFDLNVYHSALFWYLEPDFWYVHFLWSFCIDEWQKMYHFHRNYYNVCFIIIKSLQAETCMRRFDFPDWMSHLQKRQHNCECLQNWNKTFDTNFSNLESSFTSCFNSVAD